MESIEDTHKVLELQGFIYDHINFNLKYCEGQGEYLLLF